MIQNHSKSAAHANNAHRFVRAPLAAAIMLLSPALMAQNSGQLEEVVVTAQKRSENLQDVPISLQALGNEAITELNIQNFKEYVQMLPSVAMTPSLGAGSSFSLVYMRGIATAGDGQATTSQPSVGMYLDEQPLTTIQGNLDVHMYDIARVEALAGPQGTLYGASSQAGTIRIITNKPDLQEFSGAIGVEGTMVDGDDTGYLLEGYVNAPIGDNMAIRLVGWSRSDAGWVDNVLGSRTFPGHEDAGTCGDNCSADDITITNTEYAEDNYNTIDTVGARAALRIDLNEDWTITPQIMVQKAEGQGSWGDDLSSFVAGDNDVTHFQKEFTDDEWYMIGLTVEGKIGNFDLVYSGSYLDREVDGSFDYSDYSYWYDTIYTTGYYADLHFANTGDRAFPNQFYPDQAGSRIMGGARFTNDDSYTKKSQELRISSAPEERLRYMLGFFWQEQEHDFEQHWEVAGLADIMLMNQDEPSGTQFPDTVYLNSLDRLDKDKAVFGHIAYDISDDLELTVGARFFKPEVSVKGFFGFGQGFSPWSGTGEGQCPSQAQSGGDKPCQNVDKGISESENIARVNLTWKVNDDAMLYGTWSEGYRPGGINRRPGAGEYVSDFLTNWEFGWKTQWADNTLQFNGAIFFEEWEDFQVAFTGANAITQVANGPTAEVIGLESQLIWVPIDGLRLSASIAYYDTELQDDYANFDSDGNITKILAPKGSELPVTANFKGNAIARYTFDVSGFEAHLQGALSYEGERGSDMDQTANAIRGDVPANTVLDLSAGFRGDSYSVDLFVKNATDEDAPLYLTSQCAAGTCGTQNYGVRVRPRTIGLKLTKEF
ncbi:MAG: iron complex outermembrane receptor protein [Halieaceae bacterium]|jgi:iron complex outermembrane receptor protein